MRSELAQRSLVAQPSRHCARTMLATVCGKQKPVRRRLGRHPRTRWIPPALPSYYSPPTADPPARETASAKRQKRDERRTMPCTCTLARRQEMARELLARIRRRFEHFSENHCSPHWPFGRMPILGSPKLAHPRWLVCNRIGWPEGECKKVLRAAGKRNDSQPKSPLVSLLKPGDPLRGSGRLR